VLGGPAHTGVNFGGNPANLGASPHDWGFAKKAMQTYSPSCPELRNKNKSHSDTVTF